MNQTNPKTDISVARLLAQMDQFPGNKEGQPQVKGFSVGLPFTMAHMTPQDRTTVRAAYVKLVKRTQTNGWIFYQETLAQIDALPPALIGNGAAPMTDEQRLAAGETGQQAQLAAQS